MFTGHKMDEYNLSTGRVAYETIKDSGKSIGRGFKKVGKSLKEFFTSFGVGGLVPIGYLHLAPTIHRYIKQDISGDSKEGKCTEITGGLFGLYSGITGYAALGNEAPEFLVAPLVTNAISLFYEKGNRTKKRLIEEHNEQIKSNLPSNPERGLSTLEREGQLSLEEVVEE
jgi:hypothetical protein